MYSKHKDYSPCPGYPRAERIYRQVGLLGSWLEFSAKRQ